MQKAYQKNLQIGVLFQIKRPTSLKDVLLSSSKRYCRIPSDKLRKKIVSAAGFRKAFLSGASVFCIFFGLQLKPCELPDEFVFFAVEFAKICKGEILHLSPILFFPGLLPSSFPHHTTQGQVLRSLSCDVPGIPGFSHKKSFSNFHAFPFLFIFFSPKQRVFVLSPVFFERRRRRMIFLLERGKRDWQA